MLAQVGPSGLAALSGLLRDPATARVGLEHLPPAQAEALIELARAHGVEAWLAGYAPEALAWQELTAQRPRFIAARARAVGELRSVGAVFDSLDCPWVVVKGQALAEDLYPRPHLRYAIDTDVLIGPQHFAQAIDALGGRGWTLLDRNWPLFLRTMPGELRLRAPTGGLLDLHWHLMTQRDVRGSFSLPTADLLARRRSLPSGLPALNPVDQIVHLGVHGALSGATKLMWLLDAGLAARVVADWGPVADAAHRAHATAALRLVLLRSARWLGTPTGELRDDPIWQGICRLVDRVSPLGPHPNDPGLARSFARSARQSTGASLVELGRHGLAWFREGAGRTRGRSPLGDPTDVRSPLHQVEDPAARRQYLNAVAIEEAVRS